MWAKFVNDDYIIQAPEKAGGVSGFNKRPEIMKQFEYQEVVDSEGFDKNKPFKYRQTGDFIERFNIEEKPETKQSPREVILAQRDAFLQMFSGIRKNTEVTDKGETGAYVSPAKEEQALAAYRQYLINIESEPGFPNITLLSFGDWLNS